VGVVTLKDIILPGEMREIMNQVVSAEKRRKETAAARSLFTELSDAQRRPGRCHWRRRFICTEKA
jgi:plasmid stability protein